MVPLNLYRETIMAALTLDEVEITPKKETDGWYAEIRRKGREGHFQPAGTYRRVFAVLTAGPYDIPEESIADAEASVLGKPHKGALGRNARHHDALPQAGYGRKGKGAGIGSRGGNPQHFVTLRLASFALVCLFLRSTVLLPRGFSVQLAA